jgi:hypothetical protein
MIANWALIVVTIYSGTPLWETVGIFPTQRACFTALERDQLAHDRIAHQGDAGRPYRSERYYRCDAPTGRPEQ